MRVRTLLSVPLLGLAFVCGATPAVASRPPVSDPYADECGSCHVAYPARLLSVTQWSRVLADLERHYGVDATMAEGTRRVVARQLGVTGLAAPAAIATLPRITAQPWFLEEHDEVGTATFRSSAVRSAANCTACHAGAARGDFDEDSVRIPRAAR